MKVHTNDVAVLIAVAICAGCEPSPSDASRDTSVDAGIQGPLLEPVFPESVAAQLTLTVPSVRVDGNSADLVPVSQLATSPSGLLAVLQPQDFRVLIFTAEGSLLKTIGKRGEGPLEFMNLDRAGWSADTLWVSDRKLARLTIVPADASPAHVFSYSDANPAPGDSAVTDRYPRVRLFPWAVYESGSLLMHAIGLNPAAHNGSTASLLRVSSKGTIEQLVLRLPSPPSAATFEYTSSDNRIRGSVAVPFYAQPFTAISPDGSRIATVETSEASYRVVLRDARGTVLWQRRFKYVPKSIPPETRDSAMGEILSWKHVQMAGAERFVSRELARVIPETYPPVTDLFVGVDGRVWVGLYYSEAARAWLLIDVDGTPVELITVPANVHLKAGTSTLVWGVERDEYNVDSLVGYVISPK